MRRTPMTDIIAARETAGEARLRPAAVL